MKTISANEARANFSDVIDRAQNQHVTISRRGKPVAVVYSYVEAQEIERLKMRDLRNALLEAKAEAQAGKGRPFTRDVMREIEERGMKRLKQQQEN